MNTSLPVRERMDDHLKVAISSDKKRRLFEVAAERDVPASELIRAAIQHVIGDGLRAA